MAKGPSPGWPGPPGARGPAPPGPPAKAHHQGPPEPPNYDLVGGPPYHNGPTSNPARPYYGLGLAIRLPYHNGPP
jgi:hypothetical protein